jgi:post-segregation antitoxin (ccd killing protein)
MEYPIKAEGDKVFRNKHNPEIVISNNGPVKALSVSGNVKSYRYNSDKDKIVAIMTQGMKSLTHSFFKEELKPFDELRHPTMGLAGNNVIGVYIVRVSYYINPDMEQIEFEKKFFIENKEIQDENQFSADERYAHILQKIDDFKGFPDDGLVVKLVAAAEHVWMLEPENWYGARKDEDGRVTVIGLPKDQGSSKKDGYPFLELSPHPFKTTGFYIEAKIVDDHVEAKTAFAVTNTGDAAALITKDGFEISEIIEPGQTKYYTKNITLRRKEGNEEPLANMIRFIDEAEEVVYLQFNINYRPANDREEFLKVTGHYSIGKHKAIPIKKRPEKSFNRRKCLQRVMMVIPSPHPL